LARGLTGLLVPRPAHRATSSGALTAPARLGSGIASFHGVAAQPNFGVGGSYVARRPPIVKPSRPWPIEPNLWDYASTRAGFSWDEARRALAGLPGGRGLNIAHETVDRHALWAGGRRVAIRWLGCEGARRDLTYEDLRRDTSRFANVLVRLGVGPGDVVATVMGREPSLYVAALGALKRRSIYTPLFSAFGPDPLVARLTKARARVLVTTEPLYVRKVEPVRRQLPDLEHVLLVRGPDDSLPVGTRDLASLLDREADRYEIEPTDPSDPALLHFTSGTTGTPKGALHVHEAVVSHHATARYALDLHPDDVYWCTADPGWVTGTSYGIIAPLAHGLMSIVDEADFDAERWYRVLSEESVTVWYTAPTAIRMLMKAGTALARQRAYPGLRFLGSVGEPLNPEAVVWGADALGQPFHDNWWQTETGGIMIANFPATDIRPGSMGLPLPGIEAAIVQRTNGSVTVVDTPDVEGELALRTGWPSMFRGYLGDEERYRRCFADGYYLTGDLARRDADGYFWFVGRADDVIKSSGHLIGPFEVESLLMEHPAVAEAGVIGKPDPVAHEVVKAFVLLKSGYTPDAALERDVLAFARRHLGAVVAPKEIAFVSSLPRTRSGKIARRVLRARELGLAEGDTSTLESM
jgi:acetyl-CoA synthetase